MKMSTTTALIAGLLASSSLFAAPMSVTLKNAKNESVGTATITDLAKGVKIDLDVMNLPPGPHAFHIHETGACVGPKFETAGGHYSPGKHPHGFDVKDGYHEGDMVNVIVGADGKGKAEIVNTSVTLAAGPASLMKTGGTALVIHEKADDYKSQPAGNAGSRIACAIIK